MTPTYTEEALLHFAQVVRTLAGVQLNQTDAAIELERLRERYGPEPVLVDYGNV
jgi:hypothetical protein